MSLAKFAWFVQSYPLTSLFLAITFVTITKIIMLGAISLITSAMSWSFPPGAAAREVQVAADFGDEDILYAGIDEPWPAKHSKRLQHSESCEPLGLFACDPESTTPKPTTPKPKSPSPAEFHSSVQRAHIESLRESLQACQNEKALCESGKTKDKTPKADHPMPQPKKKLDASEPRFCPGCVNAPFYHDP